MAQRDDVLHILAGHPEGMTDAELATELKKLHPKVVHQTANTICRRLAEEGIVLRDAMDAPILNRLRDAAPLEPPRRPVSSEPKKPWPWEGAVQHVLVGWLTGQGAEIVSLAETASKQRGTDVVADLDDRRIHIEVKGWPSIGYSDPRRAGEIKPTAPTMQANHWFAEAVSSALKLRQAYQSDRVVVAFPDMPRYRTLHSERADPLKRVDIECWLVGESGTVEVVGAAPEPTDLQVPSDSPTQRAHRVHQSRWRRDVLGLPAGPPSNRARKRYPTLGNFLPETHGGRSAVDAGWNLMSAAARTYAHERVQVLERIGGVAEPDRLWRNMLSSQPLAFSIAGELRANPNAAAKVFAELTGSPVAALDRLGELGDDYVLDGVEAEWSPPRQSHTRDRSGFDIAAMLRLEDGQTQLVSVEVKYVDSFSAKPLDPERYRDHLDALGLNSTTTQTIVAAGGSQFLRSVLLTESVRRRGLRNDGGTDRCLSVVLARSDDTAADLAVQLVGEAAPAVAVARWSHGDLLAAAGHQPELADWAERMRRRYHA